MPVLGVGVVTAFDGFVCVDLCVQTLNVSYELKKQQHLVGLIHEVDALPSYFITGGLVFAPLSWPLLEVRERREGETLGHNCVLGKRQRGQKGTDGWHWELQACN